MTDKLTIARDRADELGLKYHHNANAATIQSIIDSKLAEQDEIAEKGPETLTDTVVPMTAAEFKAKYPDNTRQRIARLIHCRIQNLNPAKKEWSGEILSTGSAKYGTFKKFIPFNSPEPYHIPKILFDMMAEKKCTIWHTVTDRRGNKIRKGRLVNEYALEVLPDLTLEELDDLAKMQSLKDNRD